MYFQNRFQWYLIFALFFPSLIWAQDRSSVQQGEIQFEEEEKDLTYSDVQRMAIEKLESFAKRVKSADPASDAKFSDPEVRYLSSAYLFCTIRKGSCPMILQALFETDLVPSVAAQESSCPNLTRLWKYWIESDMERRAELDVPIGVVPKYQQFKKEARPKFIKCKQTIETVREHSPKGKEFFSSRYGEGSPQLSQILKTIALLRALEKKKINLFSAQGIK